MIIDAIAEHIETRLEVEAADRRAPADTLVSRFRRQVATHPDRAAMHARVLDTWQTISWREYGDLVRRLSGFLVGEGVAEQDHVAIWASNRPEWHICSTAVLSCRARPVPVYLTLSSEEAGYVLGHSEAVVAIVDSNAQLEKLLAVRDSLPALRRVVVIDRETAPVDDFVISWADALELGATTADRSADELRQRAEAVSPDDVATLVYTSGTTGPPKAVMALHRNIMAAASALGPLVSAGPDDRVLSYLPLAHIMERLNSEFRQDVFGNAVWFTPAMTSMPRDLAEVRPTSFIGVPRVWEKIVDRIEEHIAELPTLQRAVARRAVATGRRVVEAQQARRRVRPYLTLAHQLADRAVLRRIREAVGLDQATILISGAAPISEDVLRYLHAVGLEVCEGYGMTENMSCTSINLRGRTRIGTVGQVVDGVDVTIADDGEILMRGDVVFAGYYKDPVASAEVLADGWLHTGDVGSLDADGYLRITDRKKDLIITAGGKNIAPTNIEKALEHHPLISGAVVIGDRRPFVSALLAIDTAAVAAFAERHGIAGGPESITAHGAVLEAVRAHIDAINERLANVEQVKRWTLLPQTFSVGVELTPTYKVRRKVIARMYGAQIEAMYAAR